MQLVSKGSLQRMLQMAAKSWSNRNFDQAIELLERASRLMPANVQVLTDLGHAYGMRFDYANAERFFEKAIRVAPNKVDVLTTIARKCRSLVDSQFAVRYSQRALEAGQASPEILVGLAETYERLHQLERANELIERALAVDSNSAAALLAKSRFARQEGRLEDAECILRTFVSKAEREIQIRAYYELGTVLDRLGRFDEAMSAFQSAKILLRADVKQPAEELRIMRSQLKELRENLSPDIMRQWLDAGKTLSPVRRIALLCGHPRSGTTLLEQILDSHPEIISAEETDIFHDYAYLPLRRNCPEGTAILPQLQAAGPDLLQKTRESYFQTVRLLLNQDVTNRLLIDKNPSLTFLVPCFIRIFPEAKLLFALRDPRDVCLSCFMQPFYPLGQVSSAYIKLDTTVAEYCELMTMWQKVAPMLDGRFRQVRYEDMIEDLENVARRSLDFLGAEWNPQVLKFDEHARSKVVRSPTYADVTQKVFKRARGRWRNYQAYLEPHLSALEPFVKAFGYD